MKPARAIPLSALAAAALLLAVLGGLLACKRLDGDTLCEGVVVDRQTGARVANAAVGVFEIGGSGVGGFRLRKGYQADAAGHFAFQVDSDSEDMALLASTPEGYYTISQEAIFLRGGKNNKKLRLKAQAPAWIRLHFHNEPPTDRAFVVISGTMDGPGFFMRNDTTVTYYVVGNHTALVSWRINIISDVGGLIDEQQSVYCPGLDTTDFNITF